MPQKLLRLTQRKALLVLSGLLVCTLLLSLISHAVLAVSVSDDFNRADGGLGSNWTTMAGTTAPQIVSHTLQVGTAGQVNSAYWTANTFSGDQYAQGTMPTSTGTNFGPGIAIRLANSRGYFLWYGNATNTISLWRMDTASSFSQIATSGTLTVSSTDVWKITAVGSTITGYQNGSQVVQTTDTTYSTGSPGVWLYYAANQITNWSAGDISTTFSVGGTVSGLSGRVILENNSGNDMTVSSNGSFTFTNQLTSGSSYQVTVRTNPTSQTCTVANGTGSISSANISNVTITCTNGPPSVSAQDDFNRSDGVLGSSWTDISDGGLAISSQRAVGTSSGQSGDTRTAEQYPSDQYSEVQITGTPLTGNNWVGAAVRMQASGQNTYAGLYVWNNGSPYLQLYKRSSGTWTAIGTQYSSGILAAGTRIRVMAVGSTLALLENGVERVTAYDNTIAGGAPGIVTFGAFSVDNWSGGSQGFAVDYLSTDGNGVESYDMISGNNGFGAQTLRVLRPTHPASGKRHNFLIALPVEPGTGTTYGDGIATTEALDAQDNYNLTIIEPSFAIDPWYADNPNDANTQQETFMTTELMPWVKANLATTNYEQTWLIGFSKSGIGGQDLILRNPSLFTLAGSWDFPADDATYNQFGSSSASVYGTDANFQANYRLTGTFLDTYKAPFLTNNRLWIGGYSTFQTDIADYDTFLTTKGIAHTNETPTNMLHRWDGGWVPIALAALDQDSVSLPDVTAPVVTSFSLPATSHSLTVPVTSFTASDNIGVTGYDLTDSATPPLASSSGWSSTAPSSYTFSSTGTKTLFAWTKDAASNISSAASFSTSVSPIYTLGGTITGLSGSVTLEDTVSAAKVTISQDEPFAFNSLLAQGQEYDVTVLQQPTTQTCSVTHGSGTQGSANTANIAIACATTTAEPQAAPTTPASVSPTPASTPNPSPSTAKPQQGATNGTSHANEAIFSPVTHTNLSIWYKLTGAIVALGTSSILTLVIVKGTLLSRSLGRR